MECQVSMQESRRRRLARIAVINTAIALIPTVIAASSGAPWPALWRTLATSMLYANVIGGLAYWLVPWTWPLFLKLRVPWNWTFRLGFLIALAAVGTLICCATLLAVGWARADTFWSFYWINFNIAAIITVIIGAVISTYESMRAQLEKATLALRTQELERERALKLATEARLASLESRIHPHFLFNTLNSISSLIQEDPERAERLVERMAALLRFSLDGRQGGLVPLEREMKIVTDYLEIEKARFGERLRYRIAAPEELAGAQVPPLSIQTLVENSVKFAVAPSRGGADIRISGVRDNGLLRVGVFDSGPGFALTDIPAGHGLDNLQGRLAALFGPAARLSVSRVAGGSVVELQIPQ
jgi:two-component system sensor histidine kinase AlgZ